MALIKNPKFDSTLGATNTNQEYIFDTGQNAITAADLTPQKAIEIPKYPTDNSYVGVVEGGNALIDQMNVRAKEVAAEKAAREASGNDLLAQFIKASESPDSLASLYDTEYAKSGIDAKTEAVNKAQQDLDLYNAELKDITAQATTQKLQNEKLISGGQNLTAGSGDYLNRQNQEIDRQAAIRALPVQVKILSQQAVVTGNQNALTAAQNKLDTLFSIKSKDIENKYTFQKDLKDKVYSYLIDNQKTAEANQVLAQQKADDRKYQEGKDNINLAQKWGAEAISQGQGLLAAQIMGLNPSSPTFQQDLAKLNGQIQTQQKLNTQVVKLDNGNTVLLNTDTGEVIKNLGGKSLPEPITIPTTTPDGQPSPIVTLNGKPLNDTQNMSLGYAQRMNDASQIIDELGGKFTGLTSYLGQAMPNIWKSSDRQKFEQAERNFINAVLRKESGAAISPSEFDSAAKQYFPQPGDSQEVLVQKMANRERVVNNFLQSANVSSDVLGNKNQSGGSYEDYLKALGY